MEINEVTAATSEVQQTETSQAVKAVEMANDQIKQNGEQAMEVLEATAPGKLRVGPVTTLGLHLDLKA